MSATRKLHRLGVKLTMKAARLRDFVRHHDPVDDLLAQVRAAGPEPALDAKVVVVTGSSEGIGWVVARAFLQKGCRVVVNGRRPEALKAAVERLAAGERVLAVAADVSTAAGAERLIDETIAHFGGIDLLINNAAAIGPKDCKPWTIEAAEWSATLDANLTGPYLCAMTAIRAMLKAGTGGRIINVSSGAANSPVPGLLPYALTKGALDILTRNLAAELGGTGIAVIGLQLGSTKTEMARRFFPWAEYQLLPPPETLVPAFWHVATADPKLLNGRVLASWRLLMAQEAEPRIAAPLAAIERFRFAEQKMPAHIPVAEHLILNRAENQFGMPDDVRTMLGRSTIDVSRYPDPDYGGLRLALAAKHGVDRSCISFGNGSAELVERVLKVFVRPGEAVLSNDPSWFMFDRFAYSFGIRNDKAPFLPCATEGFGHNLDGVLAAIRSDTRLIYLISPSNPVGVPILHEPFMRFLEQVPPHIPVVIDEAYVDFADRPDILDTAKIVRETDRLVLSLRTFSKFYGLAGMRVGYAYGSRQTIDWLDHGELLFNISSLAAETARVALLDVEHARRTFENCSSERRRIGAFVAGLGLAHVPTQSNMMLFEPPTAPDTLFDRLQESGIVPARGTVLDRYVLWPIGLRAQNDRFMEVVRCLS